MKIVITTRHPSSKYGIPVCLIDGQPVDGATGFKHCCEKLDWSRRKASEMTGKSLAAIDRYRNENPNVASPIPAEVWNVIKDSLP